VKQSPTNAFHTKQCHVKGLLLAGMWQVNSDVFTDDDYCLPLCHTVHVKIFCTKLQFLKSQPQIQVLTLTLQHPASTQDPRRRNKLKVKIKVPHKRLESPEGGGRGIALHSLDLGARSGWVVKTTPWPLNPRERLGIHCTGSWVGPRARREVYEKSRSYLDSTSGPSSP
jgi:hypothetical protein